MARRAQRNVITEPSIYPEGTGFGFHYDLRDTHVDPPSFAQVLTPAISGGINVTYLGDGQVSIYGRREDFPSMRIDQEIDGQTFTLYEHSEDRGWDGPWNLSGPHGGSRFSSTAHRGVLA